MNMRRFLGALTGSLVPLLMPVAVFAQGLSGITPFQGTSQSGLVQAVTTIINILLILAGLVAAIYLLYGGVRYIASRGDEEEAGAAKNVILYAILGLIVIGLSAAIVNFVVGAIQVS